MNCVTVPRKMAQSNNPNGRPKLYTTQERIERQRMHALRSYYKKQGKDVEEIFKARKKKKDEQHAQQRLKNIYNEAKNLKVEVLDEYLARWEEMLNIEKRISTLD